MPIRRDLRHFYGREWRTVIRPRILRRAGGKCEDCGKPNHRQVWVYRPSHGGQYWSATRTAQCWHWCGYGPINFMLFGSQWRRARRVRVVLSIAHLNHDPTDNRDQNLRALCQWCHLHYDVAHHKETRSARKDVTRPLLAAAGGGSRC